MSRGKLLIPGPKARVKENEALISALKGHQVDAIVGDRHIMLVRLREAEENLENSRNQLRALATRLQSVREEERTAIAREIHDEFGQTLTSLQLGLSWVAAKMPANRQPLQQKISSLSALVTTLIQSTRRIADELRPGTLDELGLMKTLWSEAREFKKHTGIECKIETNLGNVRLNRLGSLAVFRIVQAALTNVARHAAASKTAIALTTRKKELVVTVTDNGKGIRKQHISSHDSLGIIGMRERAIALEGTFTITGSKNKGTSLRVRIPLSRVLAGAAPPSLVPANTQKLTR